MIEWKEEMRKADDAIAEYVRERIDKYMPGRTIAEAAMNEIRIAIKKYGVDIVIDSIEDSRTQYIKFDRDGNPIVSTLSEYIKKIPRIAKVKSECTPEQEELRKRTAYLRAIVRNRLPGREYNPQYSWSVIIAVLERGAEYDDVLEFCKTVDSWEDFYNHISSLV
jgi:hypothetical protein